MPDEILEPKQPSPGPSVGPWEVFSVSLALPSIRRLADRVRALNVLSEDDLAEVERVLDPGRRERGNPGQWIADVQRLRTMLAAAQQLGDRRLPLEQAEQLRRAASEEDSAAATDPPDMGSQAD